MGRYNLDGYSTSVGNKCPHCGGWHNGVCPKVKSIEYHDNGTIKKVEYKDEQNPLQSYQHQTNMMVDGKPVTLS